MGPDSPLSITSLFAGSLTFATALAWNEAAKSSINAALPQQKNNFKGQLLYAAMVTVLVITLGVVMQPLTSKVDKKINGLTGRQSAALATKPGL